MQIIRRGNNIHVDRKSKEQPAKGHTNATKNGCNIFIQCKTRRSRRGCNIAPYKHNTNQGKHKHEYNKAKIKDDRKNV